MSDESYACVYCAVDAHVCYGCGGTVDHDTGRTCSPACDAVYLSGRGLLRPCEKTGCEEPCALGHEVCHRHLK